MYSDDKIKNGKVIALRIGLLWANLFSFLLNLRNNEVDNEEKYLLPRSKYIICKRNNYRLTSHS